MNKSSLSKKQSIFPLALAALGVVYGDIGTSPLYAMRGSLDGLIINTTNVFGVLSLIFWSLIFVISIKYLIILFRADNNGEGGILALLALIKRTSSDKAKLFLMIAIFGSGLVLGDGMLTPAISILSAIEGVEVFAPELASWILPITALILIVIFSLQSMGTAKIGGVFGPVLLIWFCTLAILGMIQIIHNPVVLKAINPWYAFEFFLANGWRGYALLGGVFLVVTGGEALYADLGHFGKNPIRLAWFFVVLPSLILNYFGQGACLLTHPAAITNPFYLLVPAKFTLPLTILATIATVIASQAVISATFSLTKQAVLLGFFPHLPIIQTSKFEKGQIYIPQMNKILAVGALLLIFIFKNSNALTHAYGIAVNLVMLLTSLLIVQIAIKKWKWNWFATIGIVAFLGTIDIAFLGANIQKLDTGGWIPVAFALLCATVMFTWNKGRIYLHDTYYMKKEKIAKLFRQLEYKCINLLPKSTAIFITDIYDKSGGNFLQFLKMNRILPEHILIINHVVAPIPYVSLAERFQLKCLKNNIYKLKLNYGFMDMISIPHSLDVANELGILPFPIDTKTATYFIEISNVVVSREQANMPFFWQETLFSFLVRSYSSNLNIDFYHLPYDRTIGIGTYYMI